MTRKASGLASSTGASTALVTLGSVTIPAATLALGSVIRVSAFFVVVGTIGTRRLKLRHGSTYAVELQWLPAEGATEGFVIDGHLVVAANSGIAYEYEVRSATAGGATLTKQGGAYTPNVIANGITFTVEGQTTDAADDVFLYALTTVEAI